MTSRRLFESRLPLAFRSPRFLDRGPQRETLLSRSSAAPTGLLLTNARNPDSIAEPFFVECPLRGTDPHGQPPGARAAEPTDDRFASWSCAFEPSEGPDFLAPQRARWLSLLSNGIRRPARLPIAAEDDQPTLLRSEGARERLAKLYAEYARFVGWFASRLLTRPDEVEDIVQEVFLIAATNLEKLTDPPQIRGWLKTVALRRAGAQASLEARARAVRCRDPPRGRR